jgi:hypothetical protein
MLMPFPPAWKPAGLQAGQGLTKVKTFFSAISAPGKAFPLAYGEKDLLYRAKVEQE